jgi:hypothetical protein
MRKTNMGMMGNTSGEGLAIVVVGLKTISDRSINE